MKKTEQSFSDIPVRVVLPGGDVMLLARRRKCSPVLRLIRRALLVAGTAYRMTGGFTSRDRKSAALIGRLVQ